MTLDEAFHNTCLNCKTTLRWSGFKNYEFAAQCCEYLYKLTPRVMEYDYTVSKVKPEPPLFWHPV